MAYTFADLGTTVPLFLFRPNWSSPFNESYEWRTDVIRAFSGDEQRIATRVAPRRAIDCRLTLTGRESVSLENWLYANQNVPVALPMWNSGIRLAFTLSGAGQLLTLASAPPPAWGSQIALLAFSSRTSYELLEPVSVSGVNVTVAARTGASWPAGTMVYPVVVAKLPEETPIAKATDSVSEAALTAIVDPVASPAGLDDSPLVSETHLPFDGTAGDDIFLDAHGDFWKLNGFPEISTAVKKYGTGSLLFNGRSSYLTVPSSSAFNLGAVDYTVELWFYPTAWPTDEASLLSKNTSIGFQLFVTDTGGVGAVHNGKVLVTSSGAVLDTWHHLAFTRDGGTLRLFLNGVQVDSDTVPSSTNSTGGVVVGRRYEAAGTPGHFFSGYIDDARIVSGTALYTANFTPPASALTEVAGTVFLMHGDGAHESRDIVEHTGRAVTLYGGVTLSAAQSQYGGVSASFNGTGAYLAYPHTGDHDLSEVDFTVEAWIRLTAYGTRPIFTKGVDSDGLYFGVNSSGELLVSGDGGTALTGGYIALNYWHHVAVCRSGGVARLLVDGVLVAAGPWANWTDLGGESRIGRGRGTSTGHWSGFLDDFRLTRGLDRYGAGLATVVTRVSTISFSTETSGVWPDDMGFDWTEAGNTSRTSAYAVFGSYSVLFDGTDDYMSTPSQAAFSTGTAGDMLLDVWVRPGSAGDASARTIASKEGEWRLGLNASNQVVWEVWSGALIDVSLVGSTPFAANTWHQIRVVRSGPTWSVYKSFTLEATDDETGTPDTTGNPVYLARNAAATGEDFDGYLDLFRVFRGDGLYAATAMPGQISSAERTTYEGLDLLLDQPNWSRSVSSDISYAFATIDSGSGAIAWRATEDFARVFRKYSWTLKTRGEAETFKAFLARHRGQQVAFWVPTWSRDFVPAAPVGQRDVSIDVEDRDFLHVGVDPSRDRLLICLASGDTYIRRITDVADLGGGVLRLTLDRPLGAVIATSDIKIIHLLNRCRFATDKITLSWLTDGVATVESTLLTVKE